MHLAEPWNTVGHFSPVHAMSAPQDVQACCQANSTGPHGKAVSICHAGYFLEHSITNQSSCVACSGVGHLRSFENTF